MTINAGSTIALFQGTGTVGPFSFPFRFLADSQIRVEKITSDSTVVLLVKGVDYTITGARSYSGGSITLVSVLPLGESLRVSLNMVFEQGTRLRDQTRYAPEVVEDALDYIMMCVNQLRDLMLNPPAGVIPVNISVDATNGETTIDISPYSEVLILKLDSTANSVQIHDTSGKLIEGSEYYRSGLNVQYESVCLRKVNNLWLAL